MDTSNVDDDLVRSIAAPADDPNAPEVFYRVIVETGKRVTVNELLRRMKRPLLLLWGEKVRLCVRCAALWWPRA